MNKKNKKRSKKSGGKIKAVIFDLGGVLQYGKKTKRGEVRTRGVHEMVAKNLRISIDQYFDSIDSIYTKAIIGGSTKDKTLELMSKNLKTTPKKLEKIYFKAYKKKFKENKKLYNFVLKLKKKSYKIAILSDIWPVAKDVLMPKKYFKNFDEVITSCDVKTRKPNKEIFQIALKKLNLQPKQTLFIDNQDWNVKGAEKQGMNAIKFENNKQLFNELKRYKIE